MKDEHKEQLKKYDEIESELERGIEVVREQRREYINQHNLNKVDDEQDIKNYLKGTW